jgi:predicted CopG family antitoxin
MATRDGYTTITISEGMKARLKAMKTHPRQSYEEVIMDLLGLSPEVIRRIDNLRA